MSRIYNLIIAFFFISILNAQNIIPSKDEVMNPAYVTAKKDNKNVLLIFDASWCTWCKRMDKNMSNDLCKDFFDDNYVIVHLAVNEYPEENKKLENPGAVDFYNSLRGDANGIPFLVIFDSEGNVLDNSLDPNGNNIGSPVTKDEVEAFTAILKGTSSLKEKDLNIITEVFWDKNR